MLSVVAGAALSAIASCLYNFGVALQAVEARTVAAEHELRLSIFSQLIRRRRWLAGVAANILGWPLETAALMLAPVTVVEPTLAVGLLLLFWIGSRMLSERMRLADLGAGAAVILGVIGISATAPARSGAYQNDKSSIIVLVVLGCLAGAPLLLRWVSSENQAAGYFAALGAGFALGFATLMTKFLADDLLSGDWTTLFIWLCLAVGGGALSLLSETTALRTRPATRVAPIVFVVQVAVPVVLAPFLVNEHWSPDALTAGGLCISLALVVLGGIALARLPSVGDLMSS
jgi:hypothetical protein